MTERQGGGVGGGGGGGALLATPTLVLPIFVPGVIGIGIVIFMRRRAKLRGGAKSPGEGQTAVTGMRGRATLVAAPLFLLVLAVGDMGYTEYHGTLAYLSRSFDESEAIVWVGIGSPLVFAALVSMIIFFCQRKIPLIVTLFFPCLLLAALPYAHLLEVTTTFYISRPLTMSEEAGIRDHFGIKMEAYINATGSNQVTIPRSLNDREIEAYVKAIAATSAKE